MSCYNMSSSTSRLKHKTKRPVSGPHRLHQGPSRSFNYYRHAISSYSKLRVQCKSEPTSKHQPTQRGQTSHISHRVNKNINTSVERNCSYPMIYRMTPLRSIDYTSTKHPTYSLYTVRTLSLGTEPVSTSITSSCS